MRLVIVEVWNDRKEKRVRRCLEFFYEVLMTKEEKIEKAIADVKARWVKAGLHKAHYSYRHHVGNQ